MLFTEYIVTRVLAQSITFSKILILDPYLCNLEGGEWIDGCNYKKREGKAI